MSLLTSIAVSDEVDLLGTRLQASSSCIAIELLDGTIHTFSADGRPLKTFTVNDDAVFAQNFKAFTVVGDKLVVAKGAGTGGCLDIIDVVTGKTLNSINVSERPKKIILYNEGEYDTLIVSPHGAHVQLFALPSTSSNSTLAGIPPVKVVATTADIPLFRISGYHMAQSTLALVGARDNIVQVRKLSGLWEGGTKLVEDVCTIYPVEETLGGPVLPLLEDPDTISSNGGSGHTCKIYTVLLHSSGRILTGDDEGKIKVWDYTPVPSITTGVLGNQNHCGQKLSKPVHTAQNSRPNHLINGLLECSLHVGLASRSGIIVSTDTDGIIRLWNFVDNSATSHDFRLNLIGQHKLFDLSFTCRAITKNGWLVAGGKQGKDGEDDVCGLDAQLKMLNLATLVDSGADHYQSAEVRNLGPPSLAVWALQIVSFPEEVYQHVVVSLKRRGKAWMEIWRI